jgi:hypothetical protein
MFNANSLNFPQGRQNSFKKTENSKKFFLAKSPSLNLLKPEEKEEINYFQSSSSPFAKHDKSFKSSSSNLIQNADNSFRKEGGFDVGNLNFRSISKKLDDSVNFKSTNEKFLLNNRSIETRSNPFTPKNKSLTPRNNARSFGLNKNTFTYNGDLDLKEKQNAYEYSLADNKSDDNIQKTVIKNLEQELREKNDEIKILKKNFLEKINQMEAENKKTIEQVEQQNKTSSEKLQNNHDNLKVELNFQLTQMKTQYEEILSKLVADLKLSKHNNVSIHLYNTKINEVSTKWNENNLKLKSNYEKNLSEVFNLIDKSEYKELMERIRFFDKYKDRINFPLPSFIEKSKLNLTSEEALNDIIRLKLLEVEASHLKECGKIQIEFEKIINEHSEKNKNKLEKIKEFTLSRFKEVENINIFTNDYFLNKDEMSKHSPILDEARNDMNRHKNFSSSMKFNSNMMKANHPHDKNIDSRVEMNEDFKNEHYKNEHELGKEYRDKDVYKHEIKNEFRADINNSFRQEFKDDLRGDFRKEFKNEFKDAASNIEFKNDYKEEIRNEFNNDYSLNKYHRHRKSEANSLNQSRSREFPGADGDFEQINNYERDHDHEAASKNFSASNISFNF